MIEFYAPYLISFLFYFNLFFYFNHFKKKKLALNEVASIHANGSVLLFGYYLYMQQFVYYQVARYFSVGYFIFDLYYMFRYNKLLNLFTMVFIYHHFTTIFALSKDPTIYWTGHLLFSAELSNIPSYYVYNYIKTDNKNNKLVLWKNIQKCLYLIIRIPYFSYLAYNHIYYNDDYFFIMTASPVFLMGIIWSMKLILN